ncbi:hypothetical protein RND71_002947 [Anisodus tanguticus]|uniref:Uncharacterized protein n=1 Tax=Anisodus tanguticus TaxID=243964 RepID=A0AAE1SVR9_9SOLA|nr:hypothetical protein RND71_002947 [Anisodus tanguticus]
MQENWPTLACSRNNGKKFWSHRWDKHDTCSLSTLGEHSYFKAALTIKEKVNLLSVLKDAGIEPGGFYSLEAVKEAIKNGTGHEAAIKCNKDALGNNQLYQVYLCVDNTELGHAVHAKAWAAGLLKWGGLREAGFTEQRVTLVLCSGKDNGLVLFKPNAKAWAAGLLKWGGLREAGFTEQRVTPVLCSGRITGWCYSSPMNA